MLKRGTGPTWWARVTIALGAIAVVIGALGLGLGWGATASTPQAVTEAPSSFLSRFAQALRQGDAAFLASRVDPVVYSRFGSAQCRAAIPSLFDPTVQLRLVRVTGPEVFDYSTDGHTTAVPDVFVFDVQGTVHGAPAVRRYHFALSGGTFHYFLDCRAGTGGP